MLGTLKIAGWLIVLLMLLAVTYALVMSVRYWPVVGV